MVNESAVGGIKKIITVVNLLLQQSFLNTCFVFYTSIFCEWPVQGREQSFFFFFLVNFFFTHCFVFFSPADRSLPRMIKHSVIK